MAFTIKRIGKESGKLRIEYNVDYAVGRVGSNQREDTMLVQALLRILYYELMGFNDGFDPPQGSTGVIAVDGWYGRQTQLHIDDFQDQIIRRGKNVLRDGIFDPFRSSGELSKISKTQYCLELLNNGCANMCESNGIDNFDNLPNRTDVPQALRNALKVVKTTAAKYQGQSAVH